MKPNRISIRWKLFTYFLVFIAVTAILLWLTQVVFLENIYKRMKISEIYHTASVLVDNVDSDSLSDRANEIGHKYGICILVLKMESENSAHRVVSVETLPNCAIHNTSKETVFTLYDSAVESGGSNLQRFRYDKAGKVYVSIGDDFFSQTKDEESIIYTVITSDKNNIPVLVIMNSVISPVDATVSTLNILLISITLLLLVLALILAVVISRRISDPIINLSESAKRLGRGELDTHFESEGFRELAELGETLNYASAEISKVERLRREFIANISHDLRTPLTMITGYSEAMRDLPDENNAENIQVVIDEANRLTSLVNNILDISKFQSGTAELSLSEFAITAEISDTVARYEKLCSADNYKFIFEYDSELVCVTDPVRYMQALCNLINNAVTYTGADNTVLLRQELIDGKTVRVSVIDSGPGIPAEKLPLIWDRYYKANTEHRRATVGSGLGLSIVKAIMGLLGGSCGVVSTEGSGSTFYIDIPYKTTLPE